MLLSKRMQNRNFSHQIHRHCPDSIQNHLLPNYPGLPLTGLAAMALAPGCSPSGSQRAPVPAFGSSRPSARKPDTGSGLTQLSVAAKSSPWFTRPHVT